MPILLLIRHGENDFVKTGKMPGRLPGIHLNEKGLKQAQALAEALKDVPIKAIYSSPLERALETTEPIAKARKLSIIEVPGLADPNIGTWQGKSLKVLRRTKVWNIVQSAPSRFQFPEGESFMEVQSRVVAALEGIVRKHKNPRDIVAVIFHADPIKLAVSFFLGLPLDRFQRLACDTGSVTVLYVGEMGASLMKLNQRPPFEFLQQQKSKK
jgi:broad specificity phosphatase PhoE